MNIDEKRLCLTQDEQKALKDAVATMRDSSLNTHNVYSVDLVAVKC